MLCDLFTSSNPGELPAAEEASATVAVQGLLSQRAQAMEEGNEDHARALARVSGGLLTPYIHPLTP